MKFVLPEPESEALRRRITSWRGGLASSIVAAVEVPRAARRASATTASRVGEVLRRVVLLELSTDVIDLAVEIEPAVLRSLDAIHVASALSLGADLGAFVTYDERQREAVETAGLPALAPRR